MGGALTPSRSDTEVGETLRQKAGQEPPGVWADEGAEEAKTGLLGREDPGLPRARWLEDLPGG